MANISSNISKGSQAGSAGQTGGIGRTHSMTGSAAKVFREFKWGLLTLFLLMAVVVGLVYDGGRKKAKVEAAKAAERLAATGIERNLDEAVDASIPLAPIAPVGGAILAADSASAAGGIAVVHAGTGGVSVDRVPTTGTTLTPTGGGASTGHVGRRTGRSVRAIGGTRTPATSDVATAPDSSSHVGVPPNPGTSIVSSHEVTPSVGKTYTVKSGDNLTQIANTVLPGKGNLKALLDANKDVLSDANHLKPGMTLKIPAALPVAVVPLLKKTTESVPPAVIVSDKEKSKPAAKVDGISKDTTAEDYVVQGGDTLERIARKLFNDGRRWRDIYEWNREQLPEPGRLKVGQILHIKSSVSSAIPASKEVGNNPIAHSEVEIRASREPKPERRHVSANEAASGEPTVEVMSVAVPSL